MATEQVINPWDVQAGTDEHGNTKSFDYLAISQYAHYHTLSTAHTHTSD